MGYIGSTPTTQNFIAGTQQFTGTGSTTNWTLSRFVNSANDIQVTIANVVQNPTSYAVSGNTLTISPAIANGVVFYVRYLSTTLQSIAPGQGSVGTAQIQDSAITTAKIATGAVATIDIADAAVTPTKLSQPLTLGTAVTASGTSVDFTGIPAWVKRVTMMFNGVSTNGTSIPQIQLGAGTVDTTGYLAIVGNVQTTVNTTRAVTSTTGFYIQHATQATDTTQGAVTFMLIGSNTWVCSGTVYSIQSGSTGVNPISGSKTLSGTLDRVRITTVNGTDTFDAGTINIMYEG